jgi:hypothetical protein
MTKLHSKSRSQSPVIRSADEERALHGDTLHEGQLKNIAREFVDSVRTRRGWPVERKIVAHADKQRTLSRKR